MDYLGVYDFIYTKLQKMQINLYWHKDHWLPGVRGGDAINSKRAFRNFGVREYYNLFKDDQTRLSNNH